MRKKRNLDALVGSRQSFQTREGAYNAPTPGTVLYRYSTLL